MFELSETGNQNVINLVEYRSEIKTLLDEFYSVQFFLKRKEILPQIGHVFLQKRIPLYSQNYKLVIFWI